MYKLRLKLLIKQVSKKIIKVAENIHNCPPGIWYEFTEEQKDYYNLLREEFSYKNHPLFLHPDAPKQVPDWWNTLAHNFSTIAVWRFFYKNNATNYHYEKD